jgi:hypothetical protein
MNNFEKKVLTFGANVGRFESKRKLLNTYLFGGFFIIIGCVFAYLSFIPTLPISCYNNSEQKTADTLCNNQNKDQKACDNATNILEQKKKNCTVKTKHRSFLIIGFILIAIAIISIIYSRYRDNLFQTNLKAIAEGDYELGDLNRHTHTIARVL